MFRGLRRDPFTPYRSRGEIDQKRLMDVRGKGFEQAHDFKQTGDSSARLTFTREPLSHGVDRDSEILCGLGFRQSEAFDSLDDLSSDSAGDRLFRGFGRGLIHFEGLHRVRSKKAPERVSGAGGLEVEEVFDQG
jgi:hypothetical protein